MILFFLCHMLTAIKLNDNSLFKTHKINNVLSNRLLTPEF